MIRTAVVLLALVLPALSWADAKTISMTSRDQKINFDDDLIQGSLTTPDGEYVDSQTRAQHDSVIKVRENFDQQVIDSLEQIDNVGPP